MNHSFNYLSVKAFIIGFTLFAFNSIIIAQSASNKVIRQKLLMDFGWRFAYGDPCNPADDFNNGTSYFSYYAKAGYGDGAAAKDFDDRGWRILNLPHDWAVEMPFDSTASPSHGYKALGPGFPENSIGWYRKSFHIPESDLGKKISIRFDGVFRNSKVWVNGFYLGQEHSGYAGFQYDITDYLNYGGDNEIAVRVDARMEEGWFYEGAGIYRHVWLLKTDPLHVATYGTFVTADVNGQSATVKARATIINENEKPAVFSVEQTILDANGKTIANRLLNNLNLKAGSKKQYYCTMDVSNAKLWSPEYPYRYKLVTTVRSGNTITDRYETRFGIRTLRFDASKGFFLNGKHVLIKGTNNHQDHAGVGVALPDALQTYRILRLKAMGANAYRCSHNPPTPELLDACDSLGMMVLDENRLMGINKEHLSLLKQMILRDRNHPSIILWSIGNEEWSIEGNEKGVRIASTMQSFVHQLDSSRLVTAASSGGWDHGISTVTDIAGYNYIHNGNIDQHHSLFPDQPSVGTEESTSHGARGTYVNDPAHGRLEQTDRVSPKFSIEKGIKFYSQRPFLSGLFFWTGFDYRGEPNPVGWPQVSSEYGILDQCGYPKDIFYYLRSWWTNDPVLHIFPHWNWNKGDTVDVWVYSNCKEVELFLNNKSLGRKEMPEYGHLSWNVPYYPGKLLAIGYKDGKAIATDKVETTGKPKAVVLTADHSVINADGEDVSVITVSVNDNKKRSVPTADNEVTFQLNGPGKIIGVGNGDPASHEPDKYLDKLDRVMIKDLKKKTVNSLKNLPEVSFNYDDSNWQPAFRTEGRENRIAQDTAKMIVIRGSFTLDAFTTETKITLFAKSLCQEQSVYINGKLIAEHVKRDAPGQSYILDHTILRPGKNVYAVVGTPLVKRNQWEYLNTDPGLVQVINPHDPWKRRLFNGMAQVIVQSEQKAGEITLTATSPGLTTAVIKVQTKPVKLRPAIAEK